MLWSYDAIKYDAWCIIIAFIQTDDLLNMLWIVHRFSLLINKILIKTICEKLCIHDYLICICGKTYLQIKVGSHNKCLICLNLLSRKLTLFPSNFYICGWEKWRKTHMYVGILPMMCRTYMRSQLLKDGFAKLYNYRNFISVYLRRPHMLAYDRQ